MKTRKLIVNLTKDDEILEREAKTFGTNSSHIIIPSKHKGKKITLICAEDVEEER